MQRGSAGLGEGAGFASVEKSFIWACLLSWGWSPEAEALLRKESPPQGLCWGSAGTWGEPVLSQPLPEPDRSCHSDTLRKEV